MRHTLTAGLVASLVACALLASSSGRAETDPKVARTWKAKCSSCHAADGNGKTETGARLGIPDMTSPAWQKKVTDVMIKQAINDGIKRPDKPEGMDPFKEKLTPEQIDQLAAFVRTLGK